jgi:hypothetical protein
MSYLDFNELENDFLSNFFSKYFFSSSSTELSLSDWLQVVTEAF